MPTSHLLPHDVTSLAKLQSGLVTLDQALGLGMSPSMVKTMLRRGTWVRVGRNVFVTHSGELGWHARAWTAILVAGEGSMLAGRSAGHLQRLVPDEPQIVHVVVPAERRVRDFPGVRFERKRRVPRPVGALPRTPPAVTVVDLCVLEPWRAVEWVTTALRERLVTPRVLRAEVDARSFLPLHPVPVRQVITDLLDDVQGLESPLEKLYRDKVEKAHSLPTGARQVRRGSARHDVLYEEFGLLCELDGRLHDRTSAVFRDLARDNAASLDGLWTHRYGYDDCRNRPCETAHQVAVKLQQLGWRGNGRACPRCARTDLWSPYWAA